MHCHLCAEEAVGRCYTCGELFCVRHGTVDCLQCETAIAPGDRRADRVSVRRLAPAAGKRYGWWRPIPADDYEPPGCYVCQALTRRTCRNCRLLYCPEHGGYPELCLACTRSARMGLIFFLAAASVLVLLIVIGAIIG